MKKTVEIEWRERKNALCMLCNDLCGQLGCTKVILGIEEVVIVMFRVTVKEPKVREPKELKSLWPFDRGASFNAPIKGAFFIIIIITVNSKPVVCWGEMVHTSGVEG